MPCQHYSFELESLELAADSELAVTVPLGPGARGRPRQWPFNAVALHTVALATCVQVVTLVLAAELVTLPGGGGLQGAPLKPPSS